MAKKKMAIVHDYLCGVGGSERVFQYMCEEFPEADIYTLAYNPSRTLPFFKTKKIKTTWLNTLVRTMTSFRWSFPLATYAMESIDLADYDVVLSSSATVAKYVKVPGGIHVCYCYIPTRALWQKEKYFENSIVKYLITPFLSYLRKRDLMAARRVDKFISISEDSRSHILDTYERDSEVINSPIDCSKFIFSKNKLSNYLLVSRLEKWKRVEFAIKAFNKLGLPLTIIGTGSEQEYLMSIANKNIQFLGSVEDEELVKEYSDAKAVIFTPELEYGLIPLEAAASGTPVIALGRAGVLETMIPYDSSKLDTNLYTAVFFAEQTSESLINAVNVFVDLEFDHEFLAQHSKLWDKEFFKKKIRKTISDYLGDQ